ncbi:nuclear pore complex protein Nup50 [Amyelois transitella]|uniref:nuclear pore complex protein Nup50 n=1 Tax=Amyelois transitella TaxID=680683 RepID=UPI00067BBE36|nr:nuclear pore complex protein Nup50 [Amyelois transitella]
MSIKRQATTELNHENWDQDDPSEQDEIGTFKAAPKDVLEKRVIRTAKRRSHMSGNEPNKTVFSGFGGFNKTQPSSFDFLSNLTNGNKNSLSPANKSDTTVTSTIFSNTPISSNSSNGIFGVHPPAEPKPMFGLGTNQITPMFGSTTSISSATSAPSLFTASKADSTVSDSPFKIQTTTSSPSGKNETKPNVSVPQVSSTMFGGSTTNSSKLFTGTSSSSPFSIKPVIGGAQSSSGSLFTTGNNSSSTKEDKPAQKDDDKKITYCSKLKGLNESVSDWIKKHVDETPFCILTPIFKDYEKYLKEIQDEYQGETKEPKTKLVTNVSTFQIENNISKSTGFSLGSTLNNSESGESKTEASKQVGFGIPMIATTTTASSSLFSTNTVTNSNGTTPFSFGIGKPFSFNSNVQVPATTEPKTNDNEDEDAPPKVEYKPIAEENSIYEQKCKVFVKKDGNFVDKGVGTLYIKKIEENNKHQLLVRANTSLGNVLINLILASAIPTQRMGKNNVIMVCIPTPDSKPPPVQILIRVKTTEEADELLEMLNKYKS